MFSSWYQDILSPLGLEIWVQVLISNHSEIAESEFLGRLETKICFVTREKVILPIYRNHNT